MRFEQIIEPVTRALAIAVREICGVVLFAGMRLHLWQVRKPLGMPSYPGSVGSSPLDDPRINTGLTGSKRGNQLSQLRLATASCPAGTTTA